MEKRVVIIPLFNEQGTVVEVVRELRNHFSGDVLIVDDGSTDGSADLLLKEKIPGVDVVSHSENLGYGRALATGFSYVVRLGYDRAVTMDCDAQHEPSEVPGLFAQSAEVDILSGSRYLSGSKVCGAPPTDRLNINREITARIRELLGLEITDAFCGFKAYRVPILKHIVLDEAGYGVPLQFWVQVKALGLSLREAPVSRIYTHVERSFGVELDDPVKRLAYYESVLQREMERWKIG